LPAGSKIVPLMVVEPPSEHVWMPASLPAPLDDELDEELDPASPPVPLDDELDPASPPVPLDDELDVVLDVDELVEVLLLELELDEVLVPHSQVPQLDPSALQAWPPTHAPGPTQVWVAPGVQTLLLPVPPLPPAAMILVPPQEERETAAMVEASKSPDIPQNCRSVRMPERRSATLPCVKRCQGVTHFQVKRRQPCVPRSRSMASGALGSLEK
jgi:hypothetical protein